MKFNLFRFFRSCVCSFVFLAVFMSTLSASTEWGWRERLDVDVRTFSRSLKIINTHVVHHEMYQLETQISPYVQFSGNPANVCMGAITLLVQCSANTIYPVTIFIQNTESGKIIFCSQQTADLEPSFSQITERISFSPDDSHPNNIALQAFLKKLGHSKFKDSTAHVSVDKKAGKTKKTLREESKMAQSASAADFSLKRSSSADFEVGAGSIHSATTYSNFAPTFQHTEQKLVYYLLKDNGYNFRRHIHKALMEISNDPNIKQDPSLFYKNIVGLILHVHTRLDVCGNCNDSLVLFREKALSILNAPLVVEEGRRSSSSSLAVRTIDAPILVTVSSRARNDTRREKMGYDNYWEGSQDHKINGHIVIHPRSAAEIRPIVFRKSLKQKNVINIISSITSAIELSKDLQETSLNCHGIFPDVLQRFMFEY